MDNSGNQPVFDKPLIFIETPEHYCISDVEIHRLRHGLGDISERCDIVILPAGCRAVSAGGGYSLHESLGEYEYSITAKTLPELMDIRNAMRAKREVVLPERPVEPISSLGEDKTPYVPPAQPRGREFI